MENNNRPLVSICIPTYNRADILKQTLNSIVDNEAFDEDVEIVISDNCSNDNTTEAANEFTAKYSNIKYFRNEKNILDENFFRGLQRCSGRYLKLQNDYTGFKTHGLSVLKQSLKKYDNTPVFFTGNNIYTRKKADVIECHNLDEFIAAMSRFVTWIGCFGAWRDAFNQIRDPLKYAEYHFNQVDWMYQIVSRRNNCIIIDTDIYQSFFDLSGMNSMIRHGYNFFEVFIKNYYKIMKHYKNQISKETFFEEKNNCLKHIKPILMLTFIQRPQEFRSETKGAFGILFSHFYRIPLFWFYIIMFPFFFLRLNIVFNKLYKLLRYIYRMLIPAKVRGKFWNITHKQKENVS